MISALHYKNHDFIVSRGKILLYIFYAFLFNKIIPVYKKISSLLGQNWRCGGDFSVKRNSKIFANEQELQNGFSQWILYRFFRFLQILTHISLYFHTLLKNPECQVIWVYNKIVHVCGTEYKLVLNSVK